VTDEHGASDTVTVTITVTGTNDAPVLTGSAFGSTNEDETNVSFDLVALGFVAVSDPDSSNFTFTVEGTGPAGFTIDPNGVLRFAPAGHYDYLALGQTEVVNFKFKVSDGLSDSNTVTIPITINGRNDLAAIDSNGGGATASISIPENTTAVTTVHATDPDLSNTITYSISGGADAGLFNIDGVTGALSFNAAPDFENPADSGANNVYDVQVKATSSDGLSDVQDISVKVTDVPEGPSAAGDYIFTTQTGLFAVDNGWLLANDTGSGLKIDSLDSSGNGDFYDPIIAIIPPFVFPTPLEFAGQTYIDLDTDNGLFDHVYLNSGDKTAFTYQASDASNATTTAAVEVSFTTSTTIDRSGDTHNVIIVGNGNNETLKGGGGDDVIAAGGGDDLIFGGGGKDLIFGEGGNDTIHYASGDAIHGGGDGIGTADGLSSATARGDVVVFHDSIDLTDAQYSGKFDGIETISLKASDGATGDQNLTINATQVLAMSNHTINPTGSALGSEGAIRIEIDSGDKLYLSNDDGGKWFNTGQTTPNGFTIFVHETDTNATGGDHENAYVMVNTAAVASVQLNVDAP
jgi:VCBS repeat-containing protein